MAALIAQGKTNGEIAKALVITEGTAANHVNHILSKLDFSSRAQVAVWVIKQGLISDGADDRASRDIVVSLLEPPESRFPQWMRKR